MRTTPQDKIDVFTEQGWWSTDPLGALFNHAVAEAGDQPAVSDPPNRAALVGGEPLSLTFSQLDERARRLAARLAERGVGPGDIVVTQLPNVVEQLVAYMALVKLQAIISPAPVQYGTHELGNIAAETTPAAYLTATTLSGTSYAAQQVTVFDDDVVIGVIPDPDNASPAGAVELDDKEPSAAATEALAAVAGEGDPNDILTICWTSGTTGEPKGVPRSHNHWLAIGRGVANASGVADGDKMLNPFPFVNLASFAGFFVPWLLHHCHLELHHPFDAQVFLGQLSDDVAYTIAPPAMLSMLLANPDLVAQLDLSAMRAIGSGSAPLAPSMVVGWQEQHGMEIINNFGSNEGMSLVSNATDVPDPRKRANYFPRFGVEGLSWSNPLASQMRSRLTDVATREVITTPGVPGELEVWGPAVFDGYLNAPEANEAVFSDDGFFRTGDLFQIAEEDDRMYEFVGRSKDIINRGGMNISPTELDGLLDGHPDIAEAAVVGYPDERLGERTAVAVVPVEGAEITIEGLAEWLDEQGVAKFKFPERLKVLDALPRNPLGKVLRRDLAELFT